MNIIAQLGRIAAQQTYKEAQLSIPHGSKNTGPTATDDLANVFGSGDLVFPPPASNVPDPRAAAGRAKYRNVSGVPGAGGSMWGDKVVGRGGVHPDSQTANATINKQFGAEKGPIGQPGNVQQSIQSQRLLAQDPRGAGGWASDQIRFPNRQHAQPKPTQYGGSPWGQSGWTSSPKSSPGSQATHRPFEVLQDDLREQSYQDPLKNKLLGAKAVDPNPPKSIAPFTNRPMTAGAPLNAQEQQVMDSAPGHLSPHTARAMTAGPKATGPVR